MEVFQQFLVVLTVLGLLCGALWAMKRKGWARTSLRRKRDDGAPRLEVIDRLPLTPAPLPASRPSGGSHAAHRTLAQRLQSARSAQIALPSALRQES